VETSGIRLPIEGATSPERNLQAHRCENRKPCTKAVFWNATPGMIVFRYQRFIATWSLSVRVKLRTVTLTLLAFPLTKTSRETEVHQTENITSMDTVGLNAR